MSKRRISPLPLKGMDTRASFGVDQQTLSYAEQVRGSDNSIQHFSNHNITLPSPSANVDVARNLIQFFMSPPGGPDQNRLVMLTNNQAWIFNQTTNTWSSLEAGYGLSTIAVPGGVTYPRFAVVNSAHQLAWTCARAGIRVRLYDGTTLTPIAQNYAGEHMIAINHRIMIANTVESGVRNAARLRWCANRNFSDWTSQSSGFMESGSNYSSGAIKAFVNYDEIALISLENELVQVIPTGSLFPAFEEGTHFLGVSIFAPHSWQTFNHTAYFLGPDTVYAWDARQFVPIGRPIEKLLRPFITPRAAFGVDSTMVASRGEYHLLATEGPSAGTTATHIFIYDIAADRWFHDVLAACSALGKINTVYQDNAFFIGDGNTQREFTLRANAKDVIGMEETGSVTQVGRADTQDFFALDSQDQPSVNNKNELVALYFQTAPSTTIAVGHSTDGGVTFTTGSVTSNAEGYAIYSVRVAFSKIRFTFRGITTHLVITGPLQMEYDLVGDTY